MNFKENFKDNSGADLSSLFKSDLSQSSFGSNNGTASQRQDNTHNNRSRTSSYTGAKNENSEWKLPTKEGLTIDFQEIAKALEAKGIRLNDGFLEDFKREIEEIFQLQYPGKKLDLQINRKDGSLSLLHKMLVVEDGYNPENEQGLSEGDPIELSHLKKTGAWPDVEVGQIIHESLLPTLNYKLMPEAKARIRRLVRETELNNQFQEYKNRVGEIVCGTVKRIDDRDEGSNPDDPRSGVLVALTNVDAYLPRNHIIKGESYVVGDRIRAMIYEVRPSSTRPQVCLSRTSSGFLRELLQQEVPEIYDGIVKVVSVARDPGSRAKVAVYAAEKSSGIDPVGACVGMRGNRIKGIIGELNNEKIDIILYSPDLATFITNAMAPAQAIAVVVDEKSNRVEVIVPDAQKSLAIGKRGQNVRLASDLVGWEIDVSSETEDSTRRQKEFQVGVELFSEALNVEEIIAQLLASEGYTSVEEIAESDLEDLLTIEGFDDSITIELQTRARKYLEDEQERKMQILSERKIEAELTSLPYLDFQDIISLADDGVLNLENISDLSNDELKELLPHKDSRQINSIIMEARKKTKVI